MEKNRLENIVWHHSEIRRQDREELLGQKGVLLWFTGLSGSGKSTVANALEKKMVQGKRVTYLLDGDNIRHGLNGDLGFDARSRKENIRRKRRLPTLRFSYTTGISADIIEWGASNELMEEKTY